MASGAAHISLRGEGDGRPRLLRLATSPRRRSARVGLSSLASTCFAGCPSAWLQPLPEGVERAGGPETQCASRELRSSGQGEARAQPWADAPLFGGPQSAA